MGAAPVPPDEAARLEELRRFAVLDTPPEVRFDRLTKLVAGLLGVPISLVSLVDTDRQWFKAKVGLDADQTHRDHAFCAHAILDDLPLVVPDASADARFRDNPLVTSDPNIRFYAGAPLVTRAGLRVGTLCAIDRKPRSLTEEQLELLRELAAVVVDELELSAALREVREHSESLARRNEELATFAHALSHDLRAPVRRIRTFCELVEEDGVSNAAEHFGHIARSAQAADGLMGALRSYFDVGSDDPAQDSNASELLAQALATLEDKITESETQVEAESLPDVRVEPGLLVTLFTNLIDNAIKYRGEATPQIRIRCRPEGNLLEFEVADNGPGISAEDQKRIFEPFVRLDTRSKQKGSGLGLSICRRIVDKAGGTIRVESQPGSGTSFFFTVPTSG